MQHTAQRKTLCKLRCLSEPLKVNGEDWESTVELGKVVGEAPSSSGRTSPLKLKMNPQRSWDVDLRPLMLLA